MKKKVLKGGFGMVEMMVAILATSILALTVGSMLVSGWTGWKRYNDSVAMQRDASLAMRRIAKEIRRTPTSGVTVGASSLICINTNGIYRFSENNGNLNLKVDSGADFPLVRGFVVASGFNSTANSSRSVRITLNLSTGSDNSNNQMIIFTRN